MFFAKYDLDGDGILDMNEGNQVVNDLDSDHIDRDVSKFLFLQINIEYVLIANYY